MTPAEWFILGFATAAAIACLRAWHLWEKEIKHAQQQHDADELDHQTYRQIMDRRGIEIVRDRLTEQQIVDRATGRGHRANGNQPQEKTPGAVFAPLGIFRAADTSREAAQVQSPRPEKCRYAHLSSRAQPQSPYETELISGARGAPAPAHKKQNRGRAPSAHPRQHSHRRFRQNAECPLQPLWRLRTRSGHSAASSGAANARHPQTQIAIVRRRRTAAHAAPEKTHSGRSRGRAARTPITNRARATNRFGIHGAHA